MTKSEYNRQYRLKNGDRLRAASRKYYTEHRTRLMAGFRAYWKANKERMNAYDRARYGDRNREGAKRSYHRRKAENPQLLKKQKAATYQKRKAWYQEYKRSWRAKNFERIASRDRVYHQTHPEVGKRSRKQWALKNKAKIREYDDARRLREMNAVTDLAGVREFYIRIENQEILNCSYCQKLISRQEVQVDHVVPLSRGGHHTADNLAVSCKRCNCSKSNRLLKEWPKCPPILARAI